MERPEPNIQISGGKVQGIVGVGQAQVGAINFYETNIYQSKESPSKADANDAYLRYPRRIFVQYLNPEIISLYGIPNRYSALELNKHALRLTRYALLLSSDVIVMPASYIFEVPFIDRFLKEVDLLLINGLLQFASSTPDFQDYARRKKTEYRDEISVFPDYAREDALPITHRKLLWLPKVQRTSAGDISKRWRQELYANNGFWHQVLEKTVRDQGHLARKLETKIEAVPERLENRAFILRFTKPLIPISLDTRSETQLGIIISQSYLESYLEELDATILTNTPIGILDCQLQQFNPSGKLRTISFRDVYALFQSLKLDTYIEHLLSWENLIELKHWFVFRWLVDKIIQNILDPSRPLENAIIKAHHIPQGYRNTSNNKFPMQEIQAMIWQLVDDVEPTIDNPN